MATSRLDVAASRRGVRVVVAAGAGREWRVGTVVGASWEWWARTVVRTSWLGGGVGCSVRDHDGGSLPVTKSDRSSLGGVRAGARARVGARCRLRRHASVNGLSDSDVRSSGRAVGGLGDVDCGGRWASAFNRRHRSVFSRVTGVGLGDGADGCAWRWNSGDAVGDRRNIGSQDVSCGQRSTVVGLATLSEDWRAVRHERCQGLSHGESACRVDDRGLVAWYVGSRGHWGLAAVLARGHCNDTRGKTSCGVSTARVSDRAGSDRGISCCSLGVVLGRVRVSSASWVDVSWLLTLRVRRLAVWLAVRSSRVHWRLSMWFTVRSSRIDRWLAVWLAVRSSWVNRWLAVMLAVRCGRVDRRLAPARAQTRTR